MMQQSQIWDGSWISPSNRTDYRTSPKINRSSSIFFFGLELLEDKKGSTNGILGLKDPWIGVALRRSGV